MTFEDGLSKTKMTFEARNRLFKCLGQRFGRLILWDADQFSTKALSSRVTSPRRAQVLMCPEAEGIRLPGPTIADKIIAIEAEIITQLI